MLLYIMNNYLVQENYRQQIKQVARKRIYLWRQSGSAGESEWSVAGQRLFNFNISDGNLRP